jgi:hypothetical protein
MSEILDLMRPGDILTHAYTGALNVAGDSGTNLHQPSPGRSVSASAPSRITIHR